MKDEDNFNGIYTQIKMIQRRDRRNAAKYFTRTSNVCYFCIAQKGINKEGTS